MVAKTKEFYLNDEEINAISINNITNIFGTKEGIDYPGRAVFENEMDIEEKIFISHP